MSRRSIPSLDGLRALSVALVVLSHFHALRGFEAWNELSGLGLLGVRAFFVISGYLITQLLATEVRRAGTINLRRFYLRRTLRIFPAYYAMLGVVALLGLAPGAHWWALFSYTSNVGPPEPWIVGHSWSLAVEEQFYLVWPSILVAVGLTRGRRVAIATLCTWPLLRALWFLVFRNGALIFYAPEDFLAAGCVLALGPLPRVPRWVVGAATPALVLYHLTFAMSYSWRFVFDMLIGQTLCAIALTACIAWSVQAAPRALNVRPLRIIGVLSYSIYLWQQIVLREGTDYHWLTAIALIMAFATVSYALIEWPGMQLRNGLPRVLRHRSAEGAPF